MTPWFGSPDVEKLQKQGDTERLIKALRHAKSDVRAAAAKALGALGDKAAVPALIELLRYEPQEFWEKRAALAKRKSYLEADLALVDERKAYIAVCQAAARSLGELKDSRAVEQLIASLKAVDDYLRLSVGDALVAIGDLRAVEPLYETFGLEQRHRGFAQRFFLKFDLQADTTARGAIYWIMRGELGKCVEIGTPAVLPLIAALRAPERDICRSAIDALLSIGDPRAVKPLTETMQHYHDYSTRCRAATALGRIGDARAVKPLEEALAELGSDLLPAAAAEALGALRKAGIGT